MHFLPVKDLNTDELRMYSQYSETQLLRFCEPELGFCVVETDKVIERALRAGYEPYSVLVEEAYVDRVEELFDAKSDIPVYVGAEKVLSQITGYPLTRGLLCVMRRRKLPEVQTILNSARRIAVLEEVENPTNLGAIFRSAAALGMDGVILTAGCTDPLYRRACRVSMGTVFQVPWTRYAGSLEACYETLREQGFALASMALREDTYSVRDPVIKSTEKLAVILGTEGEGLREATISNSDFTICIPMSHSVDSLNVAAAAAIAFWELGSREEH